MLSEEVGESYEEFEEKSSDASRMKRKTKTMTVARNAFFAADVLWKVSPDMVM